MRIFESARKHGVPDSDIVHVLDHPLRQVELSENRWLILGPDRAASLLAVVVTHDDGTEPAAIHANKPTTQERRHL